MRIRKVKFHRKDSANQRGPTADAIVKIKEVCGASYAENLISAMEQLDSNTKRTWTWAPKPRRPPKLISFMNSALLKGQPESEIIQAVVRLEGVEVEVYVTLRS